MSLETLRSGVVYSMQMNHGTIDSSGQNTAGTNNGATPHYVHNGTGAYYFNGVNNRIALGTSINPTNMINATLMAWVQLSHIPDAIINQHRTIFGQGSSYAGPSTYPLWLHVSSYSKKFQLQRNGYNIVSTTEPQAGVWYHVAFVMSGTTGKIYVNGILETTGTIGAAGGTNYDLSIGALGNYTDFNGGSWDGYIDEPGIWSRDLSSTEITSIFNKGYGKKYSELTTEEKTDLVSYWGFNGDANDEHGSNDGTVSGATLQQVKLGTGAYSFDGNDYINLGDKFDADEFTTSGVFTVAHWFKTTIGGIILSKKYSWYSGKILTTNGNYYLTTWSTSGSGVSIADTSNDYRDGKWHLGVAVFNNTTATIYIDGVLKASDSTYVSWSRNTTENTCIGGRQDLQEMFNGLIDNVTIWDRALSSTEVTELYNSGDGLELFPGVADGVISAYKFDGDATDSALYDNSITLTNNTFSSGIINNGRFSNDNTSYGIPAKYSYSNHETKDFTINFWFYGKQPPSGVYPVLYSEFISAYPFTGPTIFFDPLGVDAGTNGIICRTIFTEQLKILSPSASSLYDKWTMITFIRNSGILYVYYDGEEVGSRSSNTNIPTLNKKYISGRDLSVQSFTTGIGMDELTTWNRSLSSDEITYLYNKGNGIQYDFIIEEISGYLIKRYNGTSWEEYPVKVYNGTDWVDAKVKRYNGSEWVEL
jgi:hypothetical protein